MRILITIAVALVSVACSSPAISPACEGGAECGPVIGSPPCVDGFSACLDESTAEQCTSGVMETVACDGPTKCREVDAGVARCE